MTSVRSDDFGGAIKDIKSAYVEKVANSSDYVKEFGIYVKKCFKE